MAAIRSATGDVRMSTTLDVSCGISEKRTRVRCCGSSSNSCRLTYLVANDALAVGRPRNRVIRSATLSEIRASTEQSLFSPMS